MLNLQVIQNFLSQIRNNEIANRFAKVFSVDVLVKGSTFLLIPVYLHLMTPEEVGTFNYLFSLLQLLSILLNFGLYTAQSKLYHEYKGEERRTLLFNINIIWICCLFLIITPLYFFGLDFKIMNFLFEHPIPYDNYRWTILLALIASVSCYMLFNFLLTSENIKKVQQYNLLRMVLSNGVVILILYYSNGDKVLVRLTSYYLCETVLWLCFVRYYIKEFSCHLNIRQIRQVLSYGIPVFLLVLISTILSFSDKFFIQQQADMSVMATYTLGFTIASVCSLIIMSFQNIWLPIFLKEKNVKLNFKRTKKMTILIVIIFSLIALLMIAGVKAALIFNIIPTIYNDIIILLPFFFLSQIISAVNAMFSNYFLYFGKMTLGSITGGSVYVVSFALNYLLIPRYGVTGAIISLLIGNVVLVTTVYFVIKHLYNKNKNSQHEYSDYSIVVPE